MSYELKFCFHSVYFFDDLIHLVLLFLYPKMGLLVLYKNTMTNISFCLFTMCFYAAENAQKYHKLENKSFFFIPSIKFLVILATSASKRIPTLMCLFIGSPTHLSKHH